VSGYALAPLLLACDEQNAQQYHAADQHYIQHRHRAFPLKTDRCDYVAIVTAVAGWFKANKAVTVVTT
jgi:hypothetical protein